MIKLTGELFDITTAISLAPISFWSSVSSERVKEP